tara:strand:- start:227 stop:631 length:405 start_codon:yes stop_codon:yes gene_type:complete
MSNNNNNSNQMTLIPKCKDCENLVESKYSEGNWWDCCDECSKKDQDERWCNGESCCKRQLMNGMSWHKRLGFSTACKCAYTMADMEEWEKVVLAVKTQQPDNPLGANLTYEKYVIIKRENPGVLEGLKKQLNLE